jgi:hypothetical protein
VAIPSEHFDFNYDNHEGHEEHEERAYHPRPSGRGMGHFNFVFFVSFVVAIWF